MAKEDDEDLEAAKNAGADPDDEKGSAGDADSGDGDGGGDDEGNAKAKDWRVEKYGEKWAESIDYHRDTNKYLRGELDKAKKRAPVRGIDADEETETRRAAVTGKENGKGADGDGKGDPGEIKTVAELVDYLRSDQARALDSRLSAREQKTRFRDSIRRAREEYTGDDERGIPSFADLEENYLLPLIQSKEGGRVIHQLLQQLPDPGKAAYTLGMMLKYQDGFFDVLKGQGAEEVIDKINKTSKEAVRVKGSKGGARTTKQTADDVWNMPKEDFQKAVDKAAGRA